MAEFDSDTPEERLIQEAEELMRQKRFHDAASRYQDLRRFSPTDLWTSLGYASALECAGKINEAEQILEEATVRHRRSGPLHRFRHLFFERREDLARAANSQAALHSEITDEGPEDQLADLYFNQGRYHEARAELERLVRDDAIEDKELRASVLARIGACLRQNAELDTARDRLLEALSIDPGHHWILSELAEVERSLGNIPAARRRYLEALSANPDDHWCRGHLAQMEYEDGKLDRAVELYREIISALPKAAWAKVELAQVLAERDGDQAAALCHAALDDDPTYPWAHAQLGNQARRAGRLEQAREHYRQALSSSPNSVWILHELADICRHLGRMQEAYAHLEHSKGFDPYDATTYGYFADLLRHEGKSASAMQHLEKAVELDDEYTWAWRELAELRALDGRHQDAEAAYAKAVDLEPDEAINDGLKAFLLRCEGRRDAAMPYLERAVERQPDYLWAWREQIDYHLARHRPAEAETVARRALAVLEDSLPLQGMLAEALRRQGRRGEARQLLAKALTNAPEAPQLWAVQAELALEDDDSATAQRSAERACELDDSAEYQALRAHVLVAAGRHEEGEAIARRLIAAAHPIQPAYELAAIAAERANDLELAKTWCDRALAGPYPDDVRLTLRRARIGQLLQEADALDRLLPLFEANGALPWREVSQLFAQAGQPAVARRAAYRYLESPSCDGVDKAKGWLHLAELELTLGNGQESSQALDRALAIDRDCVPGQILGAVLADQRGDLSTAIAHLEHIDRRLHDQEPEPAAPAGDEPAVETATESALLLRQLASLYERHDQPDEASRCWQRILAEAGDSAAYRADHAAFLLRLGRVEEAETRAAEILASAPLELGECQRLLRELAITHANRGGPRDGIRCLTRHQDALGIANRLLLAQLALGIGDLPLAKANLAVAREREPANRAALMLHTRTLIAGHELEPAEQQARDLCRQEADEESASLLAECLALRRRFAEALTVLADPALPERPSLERTLLAALIRLELHGEPQFLAALGRVAPPQASTALSRLIAAAWPGAWSSPDPERPATTDDVLVLPPFPQLARRFARALAAQGRTDLAAALVLGVSRVGAPLLGLAISPDEVRELRLLAIPWLCRDGRRRQAWSLAWNAGSLRGMLRWLRG